MRILITGHEGFIGSHLWKRLWDKGHSLYGLDIKSGSDILTCNLDYDVDLVIHLAGKSGVRESIKNPGPYWHVNVEGTKRIFERFENKRILYASSSSAYEPHLNPYAASKFLMDRMRPDMAANSVGMRFHTVYSDTPRKGMFLDKLINGTAEYVTEHSRDFIHIDDLCDGIELLFEDNFRGITDIGTGKSVPIKDLAPNLPVRTGFRHERQKTEANIRELKEFGFEPKYDVKEFLTLKGIEVKI